MAKSNKPKNAPFSGGSAGGNRMEALFEQAEQLISARKPAEAMSLLKPLLKTHPRHGELHYYLAYTASHLQDFWLAASHYEQALQIERDPSLWIPLGFTYLALDLKALALHAFRQAIKLNRNHPATRELPEGIAALEEEIRLMAANLGKSVKDAEKGLTLLEEGQLALHKNQFTLCISQNQQSIRILGNWPPPHNNLSLAYFYHGEPEKAIQSAEFVLNVEPENIQALSNLTRFYFLKGREEDAQAIWQRLKPLHPDGLTGLHKKLEAATLIGDDQQVVYLLDEIKKEKVLDDRLRFYRAVAAANLGEKNARRLFVAVQKEYPWAGEFIKALDAHQTGLGWSGHFPYLAITDLMPYAELEGFFELTKQQEKMGAARFRREVDRFKARFPQMLLIGKKIMYEECNPTAATQMLLLHGTPQAYALLREFGMGQLGSDEDRMKVLQALQEAGQIEKHTKVRFWQDGKWSEVELRQYRIVEKAFEGPSLRVGQLLEDALKTFRKGEAAQAEEMFRRALKIEPRAKEAYNNLAAIYSSQGNKERAMEMLNKAIEIDRLYVMPRCNLALYLLDTDVDAAQAMISPLSEVDVFSPQEMAFFQFTQARILVQGDNFDQARSHLKLALQILPDYEYAKEYLERLEMIERMRSVTTGWSEQSKKRDSVARTRLRRQLNTLTPSLAQSLGVYSKEVMVGMGRTIIPWGGWSGKKKAELSQYMLECLQEEDVCRELVDGLTNDDRKALRQVLTLGGSMPWDDFAAAYGNDDDDSPHWQYHDPKTVMGRLRLRLLLAETTVDGTLYVAIPLELRSLLLPLL